MCIRDRLWLIAGTAAYLRETGDWSILEEQVPFDNDATKAQTLMAVSYTHLDVYQRQSANSAMWFWPPRKSDLKSLLAISFIAFSLLV